MWRPFLKSESIQSNTALPLVCIVSVAMIATPLGHTQGVLGPATDPVTRAKEIAALAPVVEKANLRRVEVKEMSVVMSGVELLLRANIEKLLEQRFQDQDSLTN